MSDGPAPDRNAKLSALPCCCSVRNQPLQAPTPKTRFSVYLSPLLDRVKAPCSLPGTKASAGDPDGWASYLARVGQPDETPRARNTVVWWRRTSEQLRQTHESYRLS